MTPALMLYSIVLATIAAMMASQLEVLAASKGWARRWIWLTTGLVVVGLTAFSAWRPTPALTPVPAGARSGPAATFTARASAATPAPPSMLDGVRMVFTLAGTVLSPLDSPARRTWLASTAVLGTIYVAAALALSRRRRTWREASVAGTPVLMTGDVGPAVVGIWTPRIVIPDWVCRLSGRAIDLMIEHERQHQRAGDPAVIAVARVLLVAMPWNPALWFLASRLKLAVELDCDARVLKANTDANAADYGALLVSVATQRSRLPVLAAPAMLERSSSLVKRIAAMYPDTYRQSGFRSLITALTVAGLFVTGAVFPMPRVHAQLLPDLSTQSPDPVTILKRLASFQFGAAPVVEAVQVKPEPPSPAPKPAPVVEGQQVKPEPAPIAGGQHPAPPRDNPPREVIGPGAAEDDFGKGAYMPGNGVTWPTLISDADPQYTREAMQAKIQGTVKLKAVLGADGVIEDIRVVKSLDTELGLDQAAIDAAKKWRFSPSKNRDGVAVPVIIEMEMEFRLH